VNAAAYTAVDQAEQESELAHRINGEAVGVLAEEARRVGALLIHYSTDYVFDGSGSAPWREADATGPLSAYGRSKRAGEAAIAAAGGDWLVLRTSWVFAARGKNFLRTILRLAAEREQLRIVADQVGAPTWARSIADATAQVLAGAARERAQGCFRSGLLHLSASGETSWHGFASAIVAAARSLRPEHPLAVKTIEPIPSEAYPLPAPRPKNSRLDNALLRSRYGLALPDWRIGMLRCLEEIFER
jgi:dTDP-4-dehydrorhamnose reductase